MIDMVPFLSIGASIGVSAVSGALVARDARVRTDEKNKEIDRRVTQLETNHLSPEEMQSLSKRVDEIRSDVRAIADRMDRWQDRR